MACDAAGFAAISAFPTALATQTLSGMALIATHGGDENPQRGQRNLKDGNTPLEMVKTWTVDAGENSCSENFWHFSNDLSVPINVFTCL